MNSNSRIFETELYAKVDYNLAISMNSNKLQNHIRKFLDKNSEALFEKGMLERVYFHRDDIDIIFDTTDLTSSYVDEVIKRNPVIKDSWRIMTKPFNSTMLMILRHYHLRGKKKEFDNALMYLTVDIYMLYHKKYFKYLPNENAMNYTINSLTNKYYLKIHGTLFKALYVTAINNHDNYTKGLENGTDKELVDYVMGLTTRINSLIKNVAIQYYDNKEKGLYLNSETEGQEEDNYNEVDNLSFQVTKIADKATRSILTSGMNHKAVGFATSVTGVSNAAVKVAIYNIMRKEDHEIRELVVLILQMYLVNGQHETESIASTKFISKSLEAYSKSNTIDKVILDLKEILDKWLTNNSDKYVKTERIATKANFRKAVFIYFVVMIRLSQ